MSKKRYKQYLGEFTKRSAKIPYDYYIKVIEDEYGAVEAKRSHTAGSKRSFTITTGDTTSTFVIHEPHDKDGYVGKWDHQNILDIFILHGLIDFKDVYKEGRE